MGEKRLGGSLWGGLIGLILGIFLGEHRVTEILTAEGEVAPTGLNPIPYMSHARFWIVLVFCTIVFAFIVGKIGRPTSQSDL